MSWGQHTSISFKAGTPLEFGEFNLLLRTESRVRERVVFSLTIQFSVLWAPVGHANVQCYVDEDGWGVVCAQMTRWPVGLGWFGGEVRRCNVHVNLHTDTRAHTHIETGCYTGFSFMSCTRSRCCAGFSFISLHRGCGRLFYGCEDCGNHFDGLSFSYLLTFCPHLDLVVTGLQVSTGALCS